MSQIELSKLYNRRKSDRDVFHELMPYKVKEILLVATYYDPIIFQNAQQLVLSSLI